MKRITIAAMAAFMLSFAVPAIAPVSASASVSRGAIALDWAEAHATGHWYCWGGAGPSCYDCSGLVMAAYAHAGIALPHSTYSMLVNRHLRRIPASARQRGDLAFYGSGHVELVTRRGTFGAQQSGTRVGWHHPSGWWRPTMYFRVV